MVEAAANEQREHAIDLVQIAFPWRRSCPRNCRQAIGANARGLFERKPRLPRGRTRPCAQFQLATSAAQIYSPHARWRPDTEIAPDNCGDTAFSVQACGHFGGRIPVGNASSEVAA